MTESGALKVNEHLQVEGFPNVFAVGDCNDVREAKTAYNAGLHADVAVANIANSVSGKQLKAYRTGTRTQTPRSLYKQLSHWFEQRDLQFCKEIKATLLKSWLLGNTTMLLAMGRDDGVGQFNGFQLPRCMVARLKSRDLLLWKSWKDMKQKQPMP